MRLIGDYEYKEKQRQRLGQRRPHITINYIPHKCHADYLDYEQNIKELLDPDEEAVKKLLDECKMAPKQQKLE